MKHTSLPRACATTQWASWRHWRATRLTLPNGSRASGRCTFSPWAFSWQRMIDQIPLPPRLKNQKIQVLPRQRKVQQPDKALLHRLRRMKKRKKRRNLLMNRKRKLKILKLLLRRKRRIHRRQPLLLALSLHKRRLKLLLLHGSLLNIIVRM